jgi:hypothetical protein
VIIPSPYKRAVPNKPNRVKTRNLFDVFLKIFEINAVKARIPPSPLLSAFKISK